MRMYELYGRFVEELNEFNSARKPPWFVEAVVPLAEAGAWALAFKPNAIEAVPADTCGIALVPLNATRTRNDVASAAEAIWKVADPPEKFATVALVAGAAPEPTTTWRFATAPLESNALVTVTVALLASLVPLANVVRSLRRAVVPVMVTVTRSIVSVEVPMLELERLVKAVGVLVALTVVFAGATIAVAIGAAEVMMVPVVAASKLPPVAVL